MVDIRTLFPLYEWHTESPLQLIRLNVERLRLEKGWAPKKLRMKYARIRFNKPDYSESDFRKLISVIAKTREDQQPGEKPLKDERRKTITSEETRCLALALRDLGKDASLPELDKHPVQIWDPKLSTHAQYHTKIQLVLRDTTSTPFYIAGEIPNYGVLHPTVAAWFHTKFYQGDTEAIQEYDRFAKFVYDYFHSPGFIQPTIVNYVGSQFFNTLSSPECLAAVGATILHECIAELRKCESPESPCKIHVIPSSELVCHSLIEQRDAPIGAIMLADNKLLSSRLSGMREMAYTHLLENCPILDFIRTLHARKKSTFKHPWH